MVLPKLDKMVNDHLQGIAVGQGRLGKDLVFRPLPDGIPFFKNPILMSAISEHGKISRASLQGIQEVARREWYLNTTNIIDWRFLHNFENAWGVAENHQATTAVEMEPDSGSLFQGPLDPVAEKEPSSPPPASSAGMKIEQEQANP